MLKTLSSLLGSKSPVFIWLVTQFQGTHVGADSLGNRYFKGKPRHGYKLERRWVMYAGDPEPSSVPPEWHAWLHHQSDAVPGITAASHRKPWQKAHRPNMTGTNGAWRPQGHQLSTGKRPKATGDYEAWTPPQ